MTALLDLTFVADLTFTAALFTIALLSAWDERRQAREDQDIAVFFFNEDNHG